MNLQLIDLIYWMDKYKLTLTNSVQYEEYKTELEFFENINKPFLVWLKDQLIIINP